jgi:hypothetical protein
MNLRNELAKLPDLYTHDGAKGDLPAVYVFTPDANATWVLWEADDEIAYGLCSLGPGFYPEVGPVSIDELEALRGKFGLPVEVDKRLDTRFKGYANIGEDVPDWMQ